MMQRWFLILVVMLPLCAIGCKKEPDIDTLRKQEHSKMKEAVGLLKGVNDESSAKEVLPRLESLSHEMADLQNKVLKSKEQNPKELTAEQMAVSQEFYAQTGRIVNTPKLSAILGTTLQRFGSTDPRWYKESKK
jgi:hypothetical protein